MLEIPLRLCVSSLLTQLPYSKATVGSLFCPLHLHAPQEKFLFCHSIYIYNKSGRYLWSTRVSRRSESNEFKIS